MDAISSYKLTPISTEALHECFQVGEPKYVSPGMGFCEIWADSINRMAFGLGKDSEALRTATKNAQATIKHLEQALVGVNLVAALEQKSYDELTFCTWHANTDDGVMKITAAIESLTDYVKWQKRVQRYSTDWHTFACLVSCVAISGFRETGRVPREVNPEGVLCRFTVAVLARMNFERTHDAVSDALRHRRGASGRRVPRLKEGQNGFHKRP